MKTFVFATFVAASLFAVGATFAGLNPSARPEPMVSQVSIEAATALS